MKRFTIATNNDINRIVGSVGVTYNGNTIGRAIRTGVDKTEIFINDEYAYLFEVKKSFSLEVVVKDEKIC